MPFPREARDEALVRSHRRCCVCHEFGGRAVNVHHIIQEADGGSNAIDNAICLCLRCHAEAGHFNSRHPLGTKYSPVELRAHRDQWWSHCEKQPDEPLGLFLDVRFKTVSRTAEVHRYRLVISYTNTLAEMHNGWKVQIYIPIFVPVEVGDFDRREVVINGDRYTEIETESNDKIFPGESIEIVPNMRHFFVEYEVNDHIYHRVLSEGKVMWKFFTSNCPVIEGERPLAEFQEF
jgi:HNH endonuclease